MWGNVMWDYYARSKDQVVGHTVKGKARDAFHFHYSHWNSNLLWIFRLHFEILANQDLGKGLCEVAWHTLPHLVFSVINHPYWGMSSFSIEANPGCTVPAYSSCDDMKPPGRGKNEHQYQKMWQHWQQHQQIPQPIAPTPTPNSEVGYENHPHMFLLLHVPQPIALTPTSNSIPICSYYFIAAPTADSTHTHPQQRGWILNPFTPKFKIKSIFS